MKVLLLYPEFPDTFWSFKHALKFIRKPASSPPLGLLTVAAMLPVEWRLRLVRKDQAEWRGLDPHDQLTVVGSTARLEGDLLHYALADLHDHFQSVISNSRTMADSYARSRKQFHWYHLVVWPWWDFFKHLVLKQGWRDGWRGWIISYMSMVGTFAKYAFLLEKRLKKQTDAQSH